MTEYQQTQTIDASAGEVFAWLSDVNNLPQYLPPRRRRLSGGAICGGHSGPKNPGYARVPGRNRHVRRRGLFRRD